MQEIQFRKSVVSAADCIRSGFELIKSNYWLFFGMAIIEVLISFAVNYVPYIGGLLSLAVSGALICGIYMALLKHARKEQFEFSLMFEGFSRFLPAFSVRLIPVLPWFVFSILLVLFPAFFGINPESFDPEKFKDLTPEQMLGILRGVPPVFYLCLSVVFILVTILESLIFFALQLIADRNLSALDAVKLSLAAALGNFGGLILLLILEILMKIGGFLVFCAGFFFVLPVIYAANAIAYERVFPKASENFDDSSPEPEIDRNDL